MNKTAKVQDKIYFIQLADKNLTGPAILFQPLCVQEKSILDCLSN